MESRNIVDFNGDIIGQLELPEGTSEQSWADHLAPYAINPAVSASTYTMFNIKQRKEFCETLLEEFKARNIGLNINALQGMWMHHRMRAMEITFMGLPVTIDVLNLVISGDVEIACLTLIYAPLDDMSAGYHWFNQSAKDFLVNSMKRYLGWT